MDVVLVVDDNPAILDSLCSYINHVCTYYTCKGFTKVDEALNYIKSTKDNIEVAILDILIDHKFDGNITLIETLSQYYPNTYIILITGLHVTDEYMKIFDNADSYFILHKPFNLDDIITLLRKISKNAK